MITFRGRISLPSLDAKRYNEAFQKAVEIQLKQAAREWLRAVIPRVPVWTGTARGSLKPLGSFLKVVVPISPVMKRPNRGPEIGAAKSRFHFERIGERYFFKYTTEVHHFILNEYFDTKGTTNPNLIEDTPWEAFIAGKIAFEDYLRDMLAKHMPKLKDYISYKNISIRPES